MTNLSYSETVSGVGTPKPITDIVPQRFKEWAFHFSDIKLDGLCHL